ncbi:ATPase [Fusobacterium sp. HMSC064B12]|uniref:VirB4 family type IV secretion/conjugal transfer ATPase n=1 Tax=Fusobacterium sp. HMSC064B12 TaxID=1739279 RepID=UPI0008A4E96D|nr:ATP-binding cassette domain-containing protein [Fusobacterium sp. HMSC064B12]OFL29759.1 ATPase [Fusobacterium sp. HMSC064B12]
MIKEYQDEKNKLSTYVPWIAMIDKEAIILNKNGTFQKTLKFRGHDLDSATMYELKNSDARLNDVLRRLDGGWTMHIEAKRVRSKEYSTNEIDNFAVKLIDNERKNKFESGNYFESEYYLTLTYLTPIDTEKKIKKFFIDETEFSKKLDKSLEIFKKEFKEIRGLFEELFLEVEDLTAEETYTYLHSCISSKNQKVIVPEVPMYIANYLCDCDLVGGLKPILGGKHFRCISLQGFPNFTIPCMFDELNRLGIEYRWSTRFMFLSKNEALSKLEKKWKATFNGRISMLKRFMMEITGQKEPTKVDEDALEKADEINTQLNLTRADILTQGFYSCAIIIYGDTAEEVDEKTQKIEKIINGKGFITINESINCIETFLGAIPGNIYNNVRIPILNSISLCHLLPTSSVWGGDEWNKYLDEPALIYTQTAGSTPFRFNLHIEDIAHTCIVGPTGAGKSTFLQLINAQYKKYKNSKIFIFDKGGSARILTYAVGGIFFDLGTDNLSFQPLRNIGFNKENVEKEIEKEELKKNIKLPEKEREKIIEKEKIRAQLELEWANEWLLEIFEQEGIELKQIQKTKLWEALELLASNSDPKFRTMSSLKINLNDRDLKDTLEKYTVKGALGKYFDSEEENISFSNWQVFEMEKIMNNKSAITPLLSYLFHKIEGYLTGDPSIIVLDESWVFIDNVLFAGKIRDWLKTLRKKNTGVIFATQELNDILNSSLFTTILDACKTKIFLPNPNAEADNYFPIYEKFGLNNKEIKIIANGVAKKDYYYKSEKGSRLFQLALGKNTLKLVGANDPEIQKEARELYEVLGGGEKFTKAYLGI